MAASAPVSDAHSWTGGRDSTSAGSILNTQGLEVGMSGMSLLSMQQPTRKGTCSTVSTSPPDDLSPTHKQYNIPPSSEHSGSVRGSSPPSPAPSTEKVQIDTMRNHSRPPGLPGPMPSPIGKPAHSKNSSATSPSLTLTPNSSVDGNSDWNSVGKQASPFHNMDPPSLPFLHSDYRRGQDGSVGSIDVGDMGMDNDGLLGLGALRERSYSSPGQFSSSPPAQKGQMYSQMDMERPRTNSNARDRPPRAQPYDSYLATQSDRSVGGTSIQFSSSSRADHANMSLDSNDSRIFGAIGRPELRQSANEYDPSRLRATSGDYQVAYGFQTGAPDQISHKFGTLPTLGSHLQQQRVPESFGSLSKPRHVRSVSQPVPVPAGFVPSAVSQQQQQQQQMPPGIDPRYYGNSIPPSRHSFSMNGSTFREGASIPRGNNFSQSMLSSSYDSARYAQKGASLPNLGGYQHVSYQSLQRRDALDYLTPQEEMRGFGPSMISPGQSPLQSHYSNHSRQPSDSGLGMLSSSPMSMGSGIMRSNSLQHSRHSSPSDDDLAHPLVGEHIEVPADHDDLGIHAGYIINHSGSHPLLRGHVQTLSMDQIPPQYIEAPHHLPTAGSALPMPKVVYSVKFKRTQRNFVLGPRINRDLKIGTYVKVEADRGEDLGIVVGKSSTDKFGFSGRASFTAGMGPPSSVLGGATSTDLKRIIRLATHDEVSLLSMKREEEDELLKICRQKVRQRGLPMNVVDAEYQFDRHKLTFFFEAEGRVDFRELVRDLFSMYKTRIWMQQLDKNTSTSSAAIMNPQTSNMQMDYGTPIIAPVSEFADSLMLNGFQGGDVRSL